jgi:hypothetical protein
MVVANDDGGLLPAVVFFWVRTEQAVMGVMAAVTAWGWSWFDRRLACANINRTRQICRTCSYRTACRTKVNKNSS